MATYLYVFPHPDDECFGPVPGMVQQRREGHEVHLLTFTRGEATAQRERLGYSKAEMAEVRYQEMQDVAETLALSSLTVREYPDGRLAELNPLVLEDEVTARIHAVEPDIVVTYPVHGVSGHPDHLVTHAVVKRAVCALRRDGATVPRRLAFYTLPPAPDDADRPSHLSHSPSTLIDCRLRLRDEDLETGREALYCYETYRPVIEKHRPLDSIGEHLSYELFAETHDPPLSSLLDRLPTVDDADGLPDGPGDAIKGGF